MDRILTLHFIDGSKLTFEFPEQVSNAIARKLKLEDLLSGETLVVEAEGSLLIFPATSIKYMALSAPLMRAKEFAASLPRQAILGATIRG